MYGGGGNQHKDFSIYEKLKHRHLKTTPMISRAQYLSDRRASQWLSVETFKNIVEASAAAQLPSHHLSHI